MMSTAEHKSDAFGVEFQINVVLNLEFVEIRDGLTEETESLSVLDRGNRLSQIALKVIQLCALHRIVIPDWAAQVFCQRYVKIESLEYRSWDEAFGKPVKSANKKKYLFKKHKRLDYWQFIESEWNRLGKRTRTDSFVKAICAHFKAKDGASVGETVVWGLIKDIDKHHEMFGAPELPPVNKDLEKQERKNRRAVRNLLKR